MKSVLNVIIGLAIGALLGDAIIHIIPHAFEEAEALAAEAKGVVDPHAGHDHRLLDRLLVHMSDEAVAAKEA